MLRASSIYMRSGLQKSNINDFQIFILTLVWVLKGLFVRKPEK